MNLTENADTIQWPTSHYVFVERTGPFQQSAPEAWQTLRRSVGQILEKVRKPQFISLYKIKPDMIYRAGVVVESAPGPLPAGLQYQKFEGGKYLRFTLKGSYSQLPEACGKVFEKIAREHIQVRDGFYIEHYVNDPETTPEDQLITEILIPV